MPTSKARAVFLDRDGTIIHDTGYPKHAHEVRLLPDVEPALARLKKHGYLLILISNQSGIGRGIITLEQSVAVHQQVVVELEKCGVQLDATYYCPHVPEDLCSCRKPSPGMLLRAAEQWQLDLHESYMIGDKAADVEAGKRAGCRTVLLSENGALPALNEGQPDAVVRSWSEVAEVILNEGNPTE